MRIMAIESSGEEDVYFLQEDFALPALEMAVRIISTMDLSPPPFLKKCVVRRASPSRFGFNFTLKSIYTFFELKIVMTMP
jgi:hypothetical protein